MQHPGVALHPGDAAGVLADDPAEPAAGGAGAEPQPGDGADAGSQPGAGAAGGGGGGRVHHPDKLHFLVIGGACLTQETRVLENVCLVRK